MTTYYHASPQSETYIHCWFRASSILASHPAAPSLILCHAIFLICPKHCTYICVFAPQMAMLGFFHLFLQLQVDLHTFFQWLGVDLTVVLYLQEGPHCTHHQLNRTLVKKMMTKKEEEEKILQKNHFAKPTNLSPEQSP